EKVSKYRLEDKYNIHTVNHSYDMLDILKKNFNNKISESLNESNRYTPSDVLDKFNDRIRSFDMNDEIEIRIERTKGSYKVIAIDKNTNKSVGRIYITDIKPKEDSDGYRAQLRRLHVSNEYRNKGIGRNLIETAIETFSDLDLHGHASPN